MAMVATGHPNDPATIEAPEGYLEQLISKYYDGGANPFCTSDCPKYSVIRQGCKVLLDDLSVDECPKFDEICREDRIAELEDWGGGVYR